MSRCNRGIVLGNSPKVTRFCRLEAGHRGEHETVWIAEVFRWATGEGK